MTYLLGKAGGLAKKAIDSLFARKQPDRDDMTGDSESQSRGYKIFTSKNNSNNKPVSGGMSRPTAGVSRPLLPITGTPRLTDPETRVCPKCRNTCSSIKCAVCMTLVHKAPACFSLPSYYKPLIARPDRKASKPAEPVKAAEKVVHLDASDEDDSEEPIPVASGRSFASASPAVTITPVPVDTSLNVQHMFVGTMSATGTVTMTASDVKLRSLMVKNQSITVVKVNVSIPYDDCSIFYYCGPDSSHVDKTVFLFIKMQWKSADELMTKLGISVTLQDSYRLDPRDQDEKYNYVTVKCAHTNDVENRLRSLSAPRKVKELTRGRAQEIFNKIKSAHDALPRLNFQRDSIRLDQRQKYDLTKQMDRSTSSSSAILTPARTSAGSARRIFQKANPVVIDLDDDESAARLSGNSTGPVTPPPKRIRGDQSSPDDNHVMAVYPPHSSHPVTVLKADLKCLKDGEYLNDNILDFYLNYILHEMITEEVRSKTLLFNTFFFNKLTSKNKPGDVEVGRDRHHHKVKNWLRHDDIFSKDFLIVPVNRSKHWFLLIVCYHNRVPDYETVEVESSGSFNPVAPCILLMDSLGAVRCGGRAKLTDPLRNLLTVEWKEKKGTDKTFDIKAIPDRRIRVTEQDNYYDCGLYLLQYVEQFLKYPSDILSSESNDFKDWVDRKNMAEKRGKILDLIERLSHRQKQSVSPASLKTDGNLDMSLSDDELAASSPKGQDLQDDSMPGDSIETVEDGGEVTVSSSGSICDDDVEMMSTSASTENVADAGVLQPLDDNQELSIIESSVNKCDHSYQRTRGRRTGTTTPSARGNVSHVDCDEDKESIEPECIVGSTSDDVGQSGRKTHCIVIPDDPVVDELSML